MGGVSHVSLVLVFHLTSISPDIFRFFPEKATTLAIDILIELVEVSNIVTEIMHHRN